MNVRQPMKLKPPTPPASRSPTSKALPRESDRSFRRLNRKTILGAFGSVDHAPLVFYPDAARLREVGFRSAADVPAIFGCDGRLHVEASWYLREVANLTWHPVPKEIRLLGQSRRRFDFPSATSLWTYANALINCLGWFYIKKIDWRKATYQDVLEYQKDMREGRWSLNKKPLAASTINARSDQATYFLKFTSDRGLRAVFNVPTKTVRQPIAAGQKASVDLQPLTARVGREKSDPTALLLKLSQLPTKARVYDWLHEVRRDRGQAHYFCCRFIVETGVREFEAAALDADQWPSKETLEKIVASGGKTAPMQLVKTKGGRPRTISIPMSLAIDVRNWINSRRLRLNLKCAEQLKSTLLKKKAAKRSKPRKSQPVPRLFLSDIKKYEGFPIRERTIARDFERMGLHGWAPHAGRHFFACTFIFELLELQAKAADKTIDSMPPGWLTGQSDWMTGLLRQQLGHVSEETTKLYLRHLINITSLPGVALEYQSMLDNNDTK